MQAAHQPVVGYTLSRGVAKAMVCQTSCQGLVLTAGGGLWGWFCIANHSWLLRGAASAICAAGSRDAMCCGITMQGSNAMCPHDAVYHCNMLWH
jgi:hypothetical protein